MNAAQVLIAAQTKSASTPAIANPVDRRDLPRAWLASGMVAIDDAARK